jgi:hypothetical protein
MTANATKIQSTARRTAGKSVPACVKAATRIAARHKQTSSLRIYETVLIPTVILLQERGMKSG